MKPGTPFRKAKMMFAALAAAVAQFGAGSTQLAAEFARIGPYRSQRKSTGATHRSKHTTAQDKRAADKRRNKQRNKR